MYVTMKPVEGFGESKNEEK